MTLDRRKIRAAARAYAEYVRTGRLAEGIRRCGQWSGPIPRIGGDQVDESQRCELVDGHYPRTRHRAKVAQTDTSGRVIAPAVVEWPIADRHAPKFFG